MDVIADARSDPAVGDLLAEHADQGTGSDMPYATPQNSQDTGVAAAVKEEPIAEGEPFTPPALMAASAGVDDEDPDAQAPDGEHISTPPATPPAPSSSAAKTEVPAAAPAVTVATPTSVQIKHEPAPSEDSNPDALQGSAIAAPPSDNGVAALEEEHTPSDAPPSATPAVCAATHSDAERGVKREGEDPDLPGYSTPPRKKADTGSAGAAVAAPPTPEMTPVGAGKARSDETKDGVKGEAATEGSEEGEPPKDDEYVEFGSYDGWLFGEVFEQHPGYCDWLLEQPEYGQADGFEDLRTYVRERRAQEKDGRRAKIRRFVHPMDRAAPRMTDEQFEAEGARIMHKGKYKSEGKTFLEILNHYPWYIDFVIERWDTGDPSPTYVQLYDYSRELDRRQAARIPIRAPKRSYCQEWLDYAKCPLGSACGLIHVYPPHWLPRWIENHRSMLEEFRVEAAKMNKTS